MLQVSKIICNKCGKQLSNEDIDDRNYNFYFNFGYVSKHDNETIEYDLCSECLDETLDTLVKTFKHVPNGWKQDKNMFLKQEDHQKVFEHWKETNEWDKLMFHTYDELAKLNGYVKIDCLNDTIKKYYPDKPLLENVQ